MTWDTQMHQLVSFHDNCGTNPVWDNWIWSTDTADTGLLSIYLRMEPYLFHFVIYFYVLDIPSMHYSQIGTLSFRSRNIFVRTPSFDNLKTDLGCKWDNLSYQYLNSCCKGDSTSGNMMLSIFILWEYWINWYNPPRKLELM